MLIVNDNPTDKQVAEALLELAKEHEIAINETYYLPPYYLTKYNQKLREIIVKSYQKTRGECTLKSVLLRKTIITMMICSSFLANNFSLCAFVGH